MFILFFYEQSWMQGQLFSQVVHYIHRYWHAHIPICLLKWKFFGSYSTWEALGPCRKLPPVKPWLPFCHIVFSSYKRFMPWVPISFSSICHLSCWDDHLSVTVVSKRKSSHWFLILTVAKLVLRDLLLVQEARKRFDKASMVYDQVHPSS